MVATPKQRALFVVVFQCFTASPAPSARERQQNRQHISSRPVDVQRPANIRGMDPLRRKGNTAIGRARDPGVL